MVKKAQKTAAGKKGADTATGGLLDSEFAKLVKDSAQQIWSAGLAAFAKTQGQGGKAFDNLAAEGKKIQEKSRGTRDTAEDKLGSVASRMSDMAGEVGNRTGQHWDKLESIFEDRVAQAMARLGVPSAKDFEALSARIDALSAAVAALSAAPAAAPASTQRAAKSGKDTSPTLAKVAKAKAKSTAVTVGQPGKAAKSSATAEKTPAKKRSSKSALSAAVKAPPLKKTARKRAVNA